MANKLLIQLLSRPRLAGATAVFLALLLVAAWADRARAAQKEKEVVGENFILADEPAPPAPGNGTAHALQGYVHHLLNKKYVQYDELYAAPSEFFGQYSYDVLTPVKATPVMATRVTAASGDRTGLAVAVQGGKVFVFGPRPCKRLQLPGANLTLLGYNRDAPVMAAFDAATGRVASIDLEACRAVAVAEGFKPGGMANLLVSPDGQWLVAITANHTVFTGPSGGPLVPGPTLAADPVMAAFTPGKGVLALLEPSGKLVLWALPSSRQLGEMRVPGGPFVQGVLDGYVVDALGEDGERTCMEIVRQSPVKCNKFRPKAAKVLQQKGDKLFFRTGLTRWNFDSIMGYLPQVYLSYSRSRNALKLKDLDGEVRYYDAGSGRLIKPVAAMDWDQVHRDEDGLYYAGKDAYRLAEVVAHKGAQLRFARYIPGKGFYLWWEPAGDLDSWVRYPGSLPVRTSLKADAPAHWMDLRGGSLP